MAPRTPNAKWSVTSRAEIGPRSQYTLVDPAMRMPRAPSALVKSERRRQCSAWTASSVLGEECQRQPLEYLVDESIAAEDLQPDDSKADRNDEDDRLDRHEHVDGRRDGADVRPRVPVLAMTRAITAGYRRRG